MTTYRLPPEPDGPVWQWNGATGEWVQYSKLLGMWVRTHLPGMRVALDWNELLHQGEVTTIKPIQQPLDELRDDIVSAARSWQITRDDAQLLEVIGLYNRKLHQLNNERENS